MDRMLDYEPTKITQKSTAEVTPVKKSTYEGSLDMFSMENMDHVIGSAVRRDAVHSAPSYIMSPPVFVPMTEFTKYMIQHDWKCKCIYCGYPHVKMFVFFLGCFYGRMLYLNQNLEVAYQFYQKAVEYYETLKICVMDGNDENLKRNFVYYSLYTHLHLCQCLMKMKKVEEMKQICESIKDLLALKMCDNVGTIEECNFTLKVVMKFDGTESPPVKKFRSFESFVMDDDIQIQLSPTIVNIPVAKNKTTTVKKLPQTIPIYVDGQKSAKMSPAQKKRLLFSKKKDTLDSPSFSACLDLGTITISAQKSLSTKVTAPARLKKTLTDIPTSSKTSTLTVKRSTMKLNKENEAKKAEPTPVKRPLLKKKQLKFSPPQHSPVENTIVLDETIDETPKSSTSTRKVAKIPKTVAPKTDKLNKKEKKDSVIVIDSDSDTSVIDATFPPALTYQQLSAQRVKRYKARAAANCNK